MDQRDVTFEDLYAYRAWVRALAVRLAGDDAEARDLEQQVWVTAVERPPRHGTSLRGWLGTVTRNAARNLRRAGGRRERHEAVAPMPRGTRSPDELAAEAEAQQVLVRAVLELDEPYRATVLLRWFDGLTPSEVAARQGVPVATVHTRLARAHAQLRERLDRKFGGRAAWMLLLVGPEPQGGTDAPSGTAAGSAAATAVGGGVMAGLTTKGLVAAAVVALALVAWQWGSELVAAGGGGEGDVAGAGAPGDSWRPAGPRKRHPSTPVVPDQGAALDAADRENDLAGIVVGPDGSPVAGAELTAVTYPWRRTGLSSEETAALPREGASAKTAPDGTFALRVGRGEVVNVRVRASGFATAEYVLFAAGERARIALQRAVTLEITLLDPSGAPVADVHVVALTWGPEQEPRVWREARSGADGVVRWDDLPPSVKLHVHPDGWGEAMEMMLPTEGVLQRTLPIGRFALLTGEVVDAATGQPIAGARVDLGFDLLGSVTTDADGRFRWRDWMGGDTRELHCTAPGYARSVLRPGKAEHVRFEMRPGVRITGRVVGADGKAVGGALVYASASSKTDEAVRKSSGRAVTAEDGTFALADLAGDLAHSLAIAAPGHARYQRAVDAPLPPADIALGDVVLGPARAIAGVVVIDDQTLGRADVFLKTDGAPPEQAWQERRRSDDQGRFRFDDLAPGAYVVSASGTGLGTAERMIAVPPDLDVTDVVLGSGADADTRRLVVRVVGDDEAPIAGSSVVVSSGRKQPLFGTTDANGIARFNAWRRAPFGTLVQANPPRDASDEPWLHEDNYRHIDADTTEVTLHLRRGAFIDGTLVDADGQPVARAFIGGDGARRVPMRTTTQKDGTFRMVVPNEGTIALRWSGGRQEKVGREWQVVNTKQEAVLEGVAPGARGVVLRATRLMDGLSFRVRVLTPDGAPVPGAVVGANDTVANHATKATTDAEGRALITPVVGRSHVLFASAQGDFIWTKIDSAMPGGEEFTLTLRRAATISGVVLDAEGRPFRTYVSQGRAMGVAPWATAPSGYSFSSDFVDADGRFTIRVPVDEEGPWSVVFNLPPDGNVQVGAKVEGVQAGATDVRLVLKPLELD